VAHALVYTAVALALLTWGGNEVRRGIVALIGLRDSIAHLPTPTHSAGRWIGIFEWVIFAMVSLHTVGRSWQRSSHRRRWRDAETWTTVILPNIRWVDRCSAYSGRSL